MPTDKQENLESILISPPLYGLQKLYYRLYLPSVKSQKCNERAHIESTNVYQF